MSDLRTQIEDIWAARDSLDTGDEGVNSTIHAAIELLDTGEARVAEPDGGGRVLVNEWLKLAILLLFRQSQMSTVEVGPFEFADKIPLKADYASRGVRVVPGASARWGSYQGPGVIMMPSYVNIGAYVGPTPWWTPGRPSVPVHRSERTCTSRGALESVAYSNRRTPFPSWSVMTALSEVAASWLRVPGSETAWCSVRGRS